jgi:aquaporin Z
MKKYVAEFIGTFFVVLSSLLCQHGGASELAPLAAGMMLMAMIYLFREVSGAHFNPAVSLAFFMSETIDRIDFLYYFLAQCVAAVLAATFGAFLIGSLGGLEILAFQHHAVASVPAEYLGTFALVLAYQVCNGAQSAPQGSIAIGATAIGAGFSFKAISGAMFNPALALATGLIGATAWPDFWIYLAGTFLGAAAATTVFRLLWGSGE